MYLIFFIQFAAIIFICLRFAAFFAHLLFVPFEEQRIGVVEQWSNYYPILLRKHFLND